MEVLIVLMLTLIVGYSVGYLTQEYRYRIHKPKIHALEMLAMEERSPNVEINEEQGTISFRVFDTDEGEFTITREMLMAADRSVIDALQMDLLDEAKARGLSLYMEEKADFTGDILIRWKPDPALKKPERNRW